jgi:serine/threonine protein kinase
MYGISQDPDTKNYIIVLECANKGSLNYQNYYIIKNYYWNEKLLALINIIKGLKKIHENKMVHRDFHTGNILISLNDSIYSRSMNPASNLFISDMGLCGEVGNIDETNIYGVMPFVAPEVLREKPYTQAADIYSFGMIMYYIATGRQPFGNCAHDNTLALNICNGIRPEINDQEAPKCYIDLMKRCWDSNPDNRPNAVEIEELFELFCSRKNEEITKQISEAEKYRKTNLLSIGNNQLSHPQAYYTSRLLNPYTKDLPKCDDSCNSTVDITDFTKYVTFI